MMKKLLSFLGLVVLANPLTLSAQFILSTNSGTITIERYAGTDWDVAVPESTNGMAVTRILKLDSPFVTRVSIPKSVTTLGTNGSSAHRGGAFGNCYNLTNITVDPLNPAFLSVDGILLDKDQLTLVRVPSGRSGSFAIPGGVTNLATWAFQGCTNLSEITIPNGVQTFGPSVFELCISLTNVVIPNSVTNLGQRTFTTCINLGSVTLPSTLSSIPDGTFEYCASLTNINLPGTITNIGVGAFAGCSRLESLVIPNGVARIGESAFKQSGLTQLVIPEGVTAVESYLCSSCPQLTNVTLPNSIGSIGAAAFWLSSLASVTLPPDLTWIGASAFSRTELRTVAIPQNVAYIGTEAFSGCQRLTNITVSSSNPAYSSVDGVLFNKAKTTLITYPAGRTEGYNVPKSVTTIAPLAFRGGTVTNVALSESVATIGSGAFDSCFGLESLIIPKSVTAIQEFAFNDCVNLKAIYFQGDAPAVPPGTLGSTPAALFFPPEAQGWDSTFGGSPVEPWNRNLTVVWPQEGGSGFDILGATNQIVVVEACTNLSNSAWFPVGTNILVGGASRFTGPNWTNSAQGFYRFRTP